MQYQKSAGKNFIVICILFYFLFSLHSSQYFCNLQQCFFGAFLPCSCHFFGLTSLKRAMCCRCRFAWCLILSMSAIIPMLHIFPGKSVQIPNKTRESAKKKIKNKNTSPKIALQFFVFSSSHVARSLYLRVFVHSVFVLLFYILRCWLHSQLHCIALHRIKFEYVYCLKEKK